MTPRYQKIVFIVLLIVSITMATLLVRLRERAHDQLLKGQDLAPTTAPTIAPEEPATLLVANDADATLITEQRSLPLPADPQARARALLDKLLEVYAAPGAMHPVPGTPRAVQQVFLLPVTKQEASLQKFAPADSGPLLAVVNLSAAFADGHPSGIQTENLTIDSICATLHANLPQIQQIRFLVDGSPRPTLAGHADLQRTYLAADAPAAPTAPAPQSAPAGLTP